MKVRLTTGLAGDGGKMAYSPGDIVDLPDEQALEYLRTGSAEPIAEKPADRREKRVVKELLLKAEANSRDLTPEEAAEYDKRGKVAGGGP